MSRLHRRHWACAIAIVFASGCTGGRAFDSAQRAEGRGDPQIAYDYYCRAAADSPSSPSIASSISRVRSAAADYWESQALSELDEGHYDDAWRMLMKALEIQ